MSMAGWYHQKAAQCARMATEATDPINRAELLKERKLWLQIAADIEKLPMGEAPKG